MKNIVMILTDGFEEIEAINTIDILRRSRINVEVVSLRDVIVTGAHGITIKADDAFDYYGLMNFDALVFVGGMDNAIALSKEQKVIDLIEYYNDNKRLICGICATPAIVFRRTKILENKEYTCYPGMSQDDNYVNKSVVVSDNVITSQSPYTAMAYALTIAKELGYDIDALQKELKGE